MATPDLRSSNRRAHAADSRESKAAAPSSRPGSTHPTPSAARADGTRARLSREHGAGVGRAWGGRRSLPVCRGTSVRAVSASAPRYLSSLSCGQLAWAPTNVCQLPSKGGKEACPHKRLISQ